MVFGAGFGSFFRSKIVTDSFRTYLEEIWKIEFEENFNPYRGKDKMLEITCLESIDLRIKLISLWITILFGGFY